MLGWATKPTIAAWSQSERTTIARIERSFWKRGAISDPSSMHPPNAAISPPIALLERPCLRATTIMIRKSPSKTRFDHVKSSAHVRRNGRPQRKRKPSASCARSDSSSRSRDSWNGVRIASSVASEKAGERAPARNGNARPSPNSAPPLGGATSVIVE